MTRDPELRQKLLQQGEEKTLQDLLAIGQAWQAGSALNSKIEQRNTASAAKTSSYKNFQKSRNDQMWLFKELMTKKGRCFRCNLDCKSRSTCIAIGKTCNKCGGPNHLASVCQQDVPFKKARIDNDNNTNPKKPVFDRLGPRQNEDQNNRNTTHSQNGNQNRRF